MSVHSRAAATQATAHVSAVRQHDGHSTSTTHTRPLWLAVGLILLGVGAAAVALLGPLVGDVIAYHASPGAITQVAGGDIAALVLVAPVSILAGILVLRGHRAGPVLALGPAIYAIYTYTQLVLGGDVIRYAGNSERFFPLFVILMVLAGAAGIRAWGMVSAEDLPTTPPRVDRLLAWFCLAMAVFLTGGLHLPGLIDAWRAQPSSPEYLADPAVFWLVKLMDLALVVPVLVAIGVGLLRHARGIKTVEYAAVGWLATLGTAVAGMAVRMQVTGDPAASIGFTIAFSLFALIAMAIAVIVYRPLFGPGQRS